MTGTYRLRGYNMAESGYTVEDKGGYTVIKADSNDKKAAIEAYHKMNGKNEEAERHALKSQVLGIQPLADAYGVLNIDWFEESSLHIPDSVTAVPASTFVEHAANINSVTGGRNITTVLESSIRLCAVSDITFRPESNSFLNIIIHILNLLGRCEDSVHIDLSMIKMKDIDRQRLFMCACTQRFLYRCKREEHELIAQVALKHVEEWEEAYFRKNIQYLKIWHGGGKPKEYTDSEREGLKKYVLDIVCKKAGQKDIRFGKFNCELYGCGVYRYDINKDSTDKKYLDAAMYADKECMSNSIKLNDAYSSVLTKLKGIYKKCESHCIDICTLDIIYYKSGTTVASFDVVLKDGEVYIGMMLLYNNINKYALDKGTKEMLERLNKCDAKGLMSNFIPV